MAIDEKVLIERLEEEKESNPCRNTQCKDCKYTNQCYEGEQCHKVCMDNVIAIVNQLAEESNLTPCYIGSPCKYQNEDAKMPMEHWDNGWIPCENELPKEYTDVLGCDYNGNIYVLQLYKDSIFGNIWRQWNGGLLRLDVIAAWQPLPAPYKPKE